jgi:cellulose synthase/poly-beta-1,6-N-acetylglucosamine synthase-like glycosyltransferase
MEILVIIVALLYFANALYYWRGLERLRRLPTPQKDEQITPISVLVPARNEAENITACLDSLAAQDYPAFEVIVIDDGSDDDTAKISAAFAARHANFHLLRIDRVAAGNKKVALMAGIAKAKGDIIATTDADCTMGSVWLSEINNAFTPQTGMLVGIPVYRYRPTANQVYQALDYAALAFTAAALVANNTPVMCSAANLAYRRETFFAAGGYDGLTHFASGDDDLLLQRVYLLRKWEIKATIDKRAFTYTKPVDGWRTMLRQRSRWGSKGAFYPLRWVRAYLSGLFLLQVFFILGFLFISWPLMLLVWLAKMIVDWSFAFYLGARLEDKYLPWAAPMVILLQPLVNVIAAVRGFLGMFKWK